MGRLEQWRDIILLPFAYLAFALMIPGMGLLLAVTWVDDRLDYYLKEEQNGEETGNDTTEV